MEFRNDSIPANVGYYSCFVLVQPFTFNYLQLVLAGDTGFDDDDFSPLLVDNNQI